MPWYYHQKLLPAYRHYSAHFITPCTKSYLPLPSLSRDEMLEKAFASQFRKSLKIKKERFKKLSLFLPSQCLHFWFVFWASFLVFFFRWKLRTLTLAYLAVRRVQLRYWTVPDSENYRSNPAEKCHMFPWQLWNFRGLGAKFTISKIAIFRLKSSILTVH